MRGTRLVIADRHPIVLQGLAAVLVAQRDFEIVAFCRDGASCLEAIRNLAPDVALLDDSLPDLMASEILAIAKAENLSARLVFFTASVEHGDLAAAIAAGACSAISKYASPETLPQSLRLAADGVSSLPEPSPDLVPVGKEENDAIGDNVLAVLTDREREIIRLVSEGLSNKAIARRLSVSQGTIKVHLHHIFQKLEINNRTALATLAISQRYGGIGTLSLAALTFLAIDDVQAAASDTSNDAAVISGTTAGAVIEAHVDIAAPSRPTATGTLANSDVGNTAYTSTAVSSPRPNSGGYGTFVMTAAGVWTHTLDNGNCAVQALDVGHTLADTFTVTTADGAKQVVSATFHGRSDVDPNDFDYLAWPKEIHDPPYVYGLPGGARTLPEAAINLKSPMRAPARIPSTATTAPIPSSADLAATARHEQARFGAPCAPIRTQFRGCDRFAVLRPY